MTVERYGLTIQIGEERDRLELEWTFRAGAGTGYTAIDVELEHLPELIAKAKELLASSRKKAKRGAKKTPPRAGGDAN